MPVVSVVTSVPLTEQTAGVVVVNVTGSPDDAVAVTVNGGCRGAVAGGAGKLIVWATLDTVKLRDSAMAPYVPSPG